MMADELAVSRVGKLAAGMGGSSVELLVVVMDD